MESVYRRHGAAVYRRALRLLGGDADTHEVVQDVFLNLFENPSQYAGKSALTTFLYSATTHACLNRLRNRRRAWPMKLRLPDLGRMLPFGAWCVVLSLWLVAPVARAEVQRFAVIIGNDRGHSDDTELRYAETDAAKISAVLRDLGGFEPANMVLLRGEDAAIVRRSLITFNDRVRVAQSSPGTETLLFVYYSGHSDAQALRLGSSRLEHRELTELVRGSAATFRVLVVDACRSGVLTRVKGARPVPVFDVTRSAGLRGEGMAFLTASSANEDAQESDELKGSFFTHALVSGLLGAGDADGDGAVVLEEAYRHAYDATLRATSRTFAGVQHPTFQFEMRGQESLVITRPGARQNRSQLLFAPGISFLVMAGSAQGAVVGEVASADPARSLSLRPGRYFVRGRGRDVLFEGTVTLAAGSAHSVNTAELDRVAYARLVRKGARDSALSHGPEAGIALRTPLPNADGVCWGASAGYRLDLENVTLVSRAGLCTSTFDNQAVSARTNEVALSVGATHAWDFSWLTANLGAGVGGSLWAQRFE
ncbi:MAG TPA: sigma factor, partial [Polyangiaceae bacterium]